MVVPRRSDLASYIRTSASASKLATLDIESDIATPALAPTFTGPTPSSYGADKADSIRSASNVADVHPEIPGANTTNSSPPTRATTSPGRTA
ncbi:unannotated protein [freshwater metagenome]|uniref:Unannotated protein n=1 Tax=freshwater metagenome TaxID=449393 RepID=A0A6J6X7R9_9ZZZZ